MMTNYQYLTTSLICVIVCGHAAYALFKMDSMREAVAAITPEEAVLSRPRAKRFSTESLISDEAGLELTASKLIYKRQDEVTLTKTIWTAVCKHIGYSCALALELSLLCLLRCAYAKSKILPFIGPIPDATQLTCRSAKTIFSSLPKELSERKDKIENIRDILQYLKVPSEEVTDFAKSGANALLTTIIRNSNQADLAELKPLVQKLESADGDNGIGAQEEGDIQLTSMFSGSAYINKNCDQNGLHDESHILGEAIQKRQCLLDFLMPGYFVFNRAPVIASTRRIAPILRVWNMPLVLFTGVKCCMSRFAFEGKQFDCLHKREYLDKPHGLSKHSGPEYVCGSIPSYMPIGYQKVKNATGTGEGGEATTTAKPSRCAISPDYTLGSEGMEGENPTDCTETTTEVKPDYSAESGGMGTGVEEGYDYAEYKQ